MNFEKARFNMVEQQIRPWDVLDLKVLDVLMHVKRELFVPSELKKQAFTDMPLPIGYGQTMLEPRVEGRALQALALKKTDHILEVGTGTGYMAALLAALGESVLTVEIEPELAELARCNLENNPIGNVSVEVGDASNGWLSAAPYDVIMVSGALPELPPELLTQLNPEGRLFAFVGHGPLMQAVLVKCIRSGEYQREVVFEGVAPKMKLAKAPSQFVF